MTTLTEALTATLARRAQPFTAAELAAKTRNHNKMSHEDSTCETCRWVATLARRDADELAAAREEQRESIARDMESERTLNAEWYARRVRATPLNATPLADELAALRADLQHALGVRDAAMEAETKAEAERDALRAQRDAAVEALAEQAAAWDSLLVEGMAPTVKLFAATCAKSCRATLLLARGTP